MLPDSALRHRVTVCPQGGRTEPPASPAFLPAAFLGSAFLGSPAWAPGRRGLRRVCNTRHLWKGERRNGRERRTGRWEGDENSFAVTISISSGGKSDCTLDMKIVTAKKMQGRETIRAINFGN